MKSYRALRFLIVFIIISAWVISSWPQVFNFPPNAKQVEALNKTTNWNFNGNSTGWTATNGTANAATSGTPACGNTTNGTTNNQATFAYDGALSGQTAFKSISGTTKNTDYRGNINQQIVAPGTGTVKAKGKFSYYGNGNFGNALISLEIWNSANNAYVGSLRCVTMTANTAWTTVAFDGELSLTGGTTYTIRVNMVAKTKSNATGAITLGVDNIVVNFAPVSLSVSGPTNSKNALLSWTASTPGSGANGLNATTPYKVYRNTSSPVSTFLANSTTNSYTDSSTVGNTTYYYAVSDVDTASDESPLSAEYTFLTKPDAPTSLIFSLVTDTSLRVSWTAPLGGAVTYNVERCIGVGCNTGWTTVSTAQALTYFDDSLLSANTTYGYRIVGNNATGAGVYSTIAYQTTNVTAVVSVSISDGAVSYGIIPANSTKSTCSSELNDAQIVTNNGNVTENFSIKGQNSAAWTLAATAGSNQYAHSFLNGSCVTFSGGTTLDTIGKSFATGISTSGTATLNLQVQAPSSSSVYTQQSIDVTITATQQ